MLVQPLALIVLLAGHRGQYKRIGSPEQQRLHVELAKRADASLRREVRCAGGADHGIEQRALSVRVQIAIEAADPPAAELLTACSDAPQLVVHHRDEPFAGCFEVADARDAE